MVARARGVIVKGTLASARGLSHLCCFALKIVMLDTRIHNKQSGAVDSALGSTRRSEDRNLALLPIFVCDVELGS